MKKHAWNISRVDVLSIAMVPLKWRHGIQMMKTVMNCWLSASIFCINRLRVDFINEFVIIFYFLLLRLNHVMRSVSTFILPFFAWIEQSASQQTYPISIPIRVPHCTRQASYGPAASNFSNIFLDVPNELTSSKPLRLFSSLNSFTFNAPVRLTWPVHPYRTLSYSLSSLSFWNEACECEFCFHVPCDDTHTLTDHIHIVIW